MYTKICNLVNEKNILILGFGREGRSTYNFLKNHTNCKSITIADSREIDAVEGAVLKCGKDYQKNLTDYDLVIKSPGIVLDEVNNEILARLTSQTELFFMCYRDRIIGVTGTKGKSTTSTLIYHILKNTADNCLLMGNIGIPSFDMLDEINDNTVIVYELSCHQLEYTKISPKNAVMLNLYPEHLDHYGTYEKYVHAKENIYRYQENGDFLICNVENMPSEQKSETVSISMVGEADISVNGREIDYNGEKIYISEDATLLVGNHNVFNIAAAYAMCSRFGVGKEEFLKYLKTYKPLAHRLEYIGEKDGIKYYDDSISTISETTVQALESLSNVGSVIIGGMDRGIDYTPLVQYLRNAEVDNIILIPDTGFRIGKMLAQYSVKAEIVYADNLKDAVLKAKRITQEGKVCVMSPAAASYGFFKNFEERGEAFRKYIFE